SVATPRSVQPIIAAMGAEYMTVPLDETADGTVAGGAFETVLDLEQDVIAVGPGLGAGPDVTLFVQELVEKSESPLVLDADALNALASDPDRLQRPAGSPPIIITPHPGEMARLANT